MATQIEKKIFYTDRGLESKIDIIQRSGHPGITSKLARWIEQLTNAFPQGRSMLEKTLNVFNYVHDPFVCQTLTYAPARVRFELTSEITANPVQYVFYKPAILFSKSYLEDLAFTDMNGEEAYSFLTNVIHELNYAAQDACGLSITRIPQLNVQDAILFSLLSEIDSEMVKTRFLREMIVPFEDGLPNMYQDSVLSYYLACEKYVAEHELCVPEKRDLRTNALLALDMMESDSENYNFDEWRFYHFGQTTAHLLNRPIGSLTFSPSNKDIVTGLETYYNERFPVLKELRQYVQNMDFELVTKYIQYGIQLIEENEDVTGITYNQLHEAHLALYKQRLSDLRKTNRKRAPEQKKFKYKYYRDFKPKTLLNQLRGKRYISFRYTQKKH